MNNYVNTIRRIDKLQKAYDHLRRMGVEKHNAESLRLALIAKMGALRALINDYVNTPGTSGRIQVETTMRLLGVNRRAMGWR